MATICLKNKVVETFLCQNQSTSVATGQAELFTDYKVLYCPVILDPLITFAANGDLTVNVDDSLIVGKTYHIEYAATFNDIQYTAFIKIVVVSRCTAAEPLPTEICDECTGDIVAKGTDLGVTIGAPTVVNGSNLEVTIN